MTFCVCVYSVILCTVVRINFLLLIINMNILMVAGVQCFNWRALEYTIHSELIELLIFHDIVSIF
jgi:hypothetical protein